MSLKKFFFSKIFLKHFAISVLLAFFLILLSLQILKLKTRHNRFEVVPNLWGMTFEEAQNALKEKKLTFEVLDSTSYNPELPKISVVEQLPKAGEKVKKNRKIYLTLNPSGYRNVPIPDLRDRTFRQAKPTLEALGLEVGSIRYKDNIAKDQVLEMLFEGDSIAPGTQVPKASKIDLILGNGKRGGN